MIGDAVDARAAGAVGAAQAFTEQVTVLLQLLEAGAYRFPALEAQADEVGDRDPPPAAMRADVPEDPLHR